MKYYKSSNFTKAIGSTGFITIVACALIAVGAIGWFALSRNNSIAETPSNSGTQSEQSYPTPDTSYNSDTDVPDVSQTEPVTDVNESVSDVPYSEEETTTEQEIEEITYILPVEGNISKSYSDSALQYSATYGDMRLHTGIDILCDSSSNIKSVAGGTVKSITDDAALGRIIAIEHTGGVTVKYCGMGSVNVLEGDTVTTGDIIGTSGEVPSECADSPHIHIEVIADGNNVSPLATLGLE